MESIKMEQKSEILYSKTTEFNNLVVCVKRLPPLGHIERI